MAFFTSGLLGADPALSYTTDSVPPFDLGREEIGNDGVTYRFVRTTAALLKGFVYLLDQAHTVGALATATNVSVAPTALCVPQSAIAAPSGVTYSYGWVAVKGPFVMVGHTGGAALAANVELYIDSVQGQLTNTSGGKSIPDVKWTTAPTVASTTAQAMASSYIRCPTDA